MIEFGKNVHLREFFDWDKFSKNSWMKNFLDDSDLFFLKSSKWLD